MKKLSVMFMTVLLMFTFAACGNQSSDNNAKDSQPADAGSSAERNQNPSVQPDESLVDSSTETLTDESGTEDGKTLVVYYSASGNTENVANYIAAKMGADVFELEPVEPYSSDDLDWTDRDSRVSQEYANPEQRDVELVATEAPDWESYDTVFIGYPIWWHIAAWPVDGFIAANDFTGKTVIPFCTSSSSGLGESGELLAEAAGTGNWLEGERFQSRASEEEVQAWVEGLGL